MGFGDQITELHNTMSSFAEFSENFAKSTLQRKAMPSLSWKGIIGSRCGQCRGPQVPWCIELLDYSNKNRHQFIGGESFFSFQLSAKMMNGSELLKE